MALSNWARGEDGEAGRRLKAEREDMDKHHFVHRPVGGGGGGNTWVALGLGCLVQVEKEWGGFREGGGG